ncbi:hypothetical protein EAF00_011841 [Botryotinia globosa]|nr:hypothetical protein EAF00_011841 [Botryotinia globosa]
MGKLTTPEERAAELRARLSGQVPNRTSRRESRVASSTLTDPMFTAALHAASRDANGAELSPLEARLTKDQAGKGTLSGTTFSGSDLSMNADTAYTDTDMVADAKAMASDFLAMPENKIIDITTTDTECIDSTEYMEALTGAGIGVTVLIASEIEEEDSKPIQDSEEEQSSTTSMCPNSNATLNTVSEYKMTLGRFRCHRQQNDVAFGPRNEIYWAVASGSDVRDERNFKTGEYGSVESHIECWEADDSGGSFYSELVQTLKDISKFSIDAAVRANETDDWGDEYGSTGKAVAILTLVALCGSLVADLLEWLTNDDDLVFRREIALTRSALTAWSRRPNGELSFMFDGGSQGNHELWIKCLGIPRSNGVLTGWKYSGGRYETAPVVAGRGLDGISLANFNNELCGVFRELNGIYHWTKYDRQNRRWSSPVPISNGTIKSASRPAVATFNDRFNGSSWTSPADAGGNGALTNDGPALCEYKADLSACIEEQTIMCTGINLPTVLLGQIHYESLPPFQQPNHQP